MSVFLRADMQAAFFMEEGLGDSHIVASYYVDPAKYDLLHASLHGVVTVALPGRYVRFQFANKCSFFELFWEESET